LSLEEKIAHFDDVAARALPLWGYSEGADKKLLNFTENATYLVKAAGKETMIMRVHRLDYATMNSIRTELCWLTDLKRDTDISLASPIPMENGELVATIETPALEEKRHVVCFSFAKGKAPVDFSDGNGDVGDLIARIEKIPDSITIPTFRVASVLTDFIGGMKSTSALTEEDRAMYRMVGEIMAKIHRQSRQWKHPDYFERMEWGFDGTFGTWNNFDGATYADPKWISQKDIGVLDQAKYTFHSCNSIAAAMCKVAAYYAVFTPLSTVLGNYLAETAGLPHRGRGGLKQMFLQFGRFFCIITEV